MGAISNGPAVPLLPGGRFLRETHRLPRCLGTDMFQAVPSFRAGNHRRSQWERPAAGDRAFASPCRGLTMGTAAKMMTRSMPWAFPFRSPRRFRAGILVTRRLLRPRASDSSTWCGRTLTAGRNSHSTMHRNAVTCVLAMGVPRPCPGAPHPDGRAARVLPLDLRIASTSGRA